MYTLKEVAERWHKTENDILRMAIEGEVVLSAWWSGSFLIEDVTGLHEEPCNGSFRLERETIKGLLVCNGHLKLYEFESRAETVMFCEGHDLVPFELTREKIFIDSAHFAEAEAKHPELVSHSLSIVQPTDREPEKPLRTIKAIAEYCEVHKDTIKDWRKKHKDFPASPPGSGTVIALPSKLNAWMIAHKKKTT